MIIKIVYTLQSLYKIIFDTETKTTITTAIATTYNFVYIQSFRLVILLTLIFFTMKQLSYFLVGKTFFAVILFAASLVFMPTNAWAQQKIDVTVTVIDESNAEPMTGATISLVGNPSKATATDVNGIGILRGVPSDGSLIINFIGYTNQTIKINNQTKIEVALIADVIGIEQVVVVGFGSQKKVNLTGAVASVSGDILDNRPISNIGQGLQGVIPNLNVSTGSGLPGQGSTYNIRGTTSLSGGSPLILVDGVQMDPNLVNPQDVSSISVLKDAASAAIYGARGAFGVILITTKQGTKNQKATISVNANLGLRQPTVIPKTMGSVDYANYMNMVVKNSGWGAPYFDDEYMSAIKKYQANPIAENAVFMYSKSSDKTKYEYSGDTDWYGDIMNTVALSQQYNISLNGGTDKTQYFMSLGYINDRGLMKAYADTYERFNANINLKSQVSKWLEVSGRALYTHTIQKMPGGGNQGGDEFRNWSESLFGGDLRPLMPIYHPDGNYSGQGNWTNPMAFAEQGGYKNTKNNDLWLTGAIKATPLKGMNIVADYTFNYYNSDQARKIRKFLEYRAVPGTEQFYPWTKDSYLQNNTSQDYYSAINAYIDYEIQLGRHYLKAMVGYNQESKALRGYGARRMRPINEEVDYIGLATGDITLQGNASTAWGVQGFVFRLNYNFDERYLLEINGRQDISSKFPAGHRSGFFPSASVAWRIAREAFMDGASSWLSDLKIRASYGQLGNQALSSNFPYYPAMGVNANYGYILGDGRPVSIGAPGLVSDNFTWETVTQLDLGLDFAFFNSRLNGSFDWYNRQTSGMMAPAKPYPAQLGANAPNVNAASMSTMGWEASLKWSDRTASGFGYSVGVVMADYQAKIDSYDNPTGTLSSYYSGQMINEVWGYTTLGKFKDQADINSHASQKDLNGGTWYAGDIKFADLDKSGSVNNGNNTLANHGDLSIIGNKTPRYSYGFTFSADWYGFDFDLFFQGVAKQDFFPGGDQFWGLGNEWGVPIDWQAGKFWTPENTEAYLPRQSFSNGNRQTQTGYKMDGAYLRLKQLTLGYTLPRSVTDKAKISKLRFYFTGQNLFCLTSLPSQYDPETLNLGTYPPQRIFSFGVNLTF